jgi:hypothetical protein
MHLVVFLLEEARNGYDISSKSMFWLHTSREIALQSASATAILCGKPQNAILWNDRCRQVVQLLVGNWKSCRKINTQHLVLFSLM